MSGAEKSDAVMPTACCSYHAGNATGMSRAMTGECHGHECGLNA